VIEGIQGKVPKSRNLKKIYLPSFGKIDLNQKHVLCKSTDKFGISATVQELMCLLGQSEVYEEASDTFARMFKLYISAPKIVSTHYGESLSQLIKINKEEVIPRLQWVRKQGNIYVIVDRSMVYARDEGRKEMKLGRIFNERKVIDIHNDMAEITETICVSHLGSVKYFFPKLEWHLVQYEKIVVIGDWAKWIWNCVEDNYPGVVQILDFYNAKENLIIFGKHQFTDDQKHKAMIEAQSELLLKNQSEQVMVILKNNRTKSLQAKISKQNALGYYIEHDGRMDYKSYKEKGLIISFVSIESANKSVILQRMKLSGQKWTTRRTQAIANLRCFNKSNAWDIVGNLIKIA
jgi:hypothetical protein